MFEWFVPLHVRRPGTLVALIMAAVVTAAPVLAQTPAAVTDGLTLEEALELAAARSETIAAAQAGVARAEGEQALARSGLFPQLSVSFSYDRALASEFEGVFDDVGFGDAEDEEIDLPFGRENTWRLNLSISQNIFSGGRIDAQQALAAVGRVAAGIEVDTARAQLLFDVTQAYYDAALSDSLVAIAEATIDQADETVRLVSAAYEAGTQAEFELLRARVTRDNQTPTLIRQRANRELALLRLKQLLDVPPGENVRLAVELDDAALPPTVFAAAVADVEQRTLQPDPVAALLASPAPLPGRAPVEQAAATVELREAALAAARSERMPSVSLTSNYGRVGYPTGATPVLDRTNWTVGVGVTVPVLTGGRIGAAEAIARADLAQSRAQLQYVQELAAVDTRSAWAELLAARAAWEATAGTVQQARRAYEIADVRYREGVSTQLELSDARLLLQQAEANRALAARDLQIARARVALLPDLPLGTGTAPAAPQPLPAPQPAPTSPFGGDTQLINAASTSPVSQGTRGFTGGLP